MNDSELVYLALDIGHLSSTGNDLQEYTIRMTVLYSIGQYVQPIKKVWDTPRTRGIENDRQ